MCNHSDLIQITPALRDCTHKENRNSHFYTDKQQRAQGPATGSERTHA